MSQSIKNLASIASLTFFHTPFIRKMHEELFHQTNCKTTLALTEKPISQGAITEVVFKGDGTLLNKFNIK